MSSPKPEKKQSSSKMGRRGDPRMHAAVAFRQANPGISLYQALIHGGFKYPTNDDASTTDADNVTLGQRKNQLSRRLRLLRNQEYQASDKGGGGTLAHAVAPAKGGGSHLTSSLDASAGFAAIRSTDASAAISGGVAGIASDSVRNVDVAQQLSRLQQQLNNSSSFINAAAAPGGAGGPNLGHSAAAAAALMANPSLAAASYPGANAALGAASAASVQFPSHAAASAAASLPSTAAQSLLAASNAASGNFSLGSLANIPETQLASLDSTAKKIGVTLEQLATALSSSSKLAQVLDSSNDKNDSVRQEVALGLHRQESAALYQRCMIMAGYSLVDAQETSPIYLQFALRAWQKEGERLKQLIHELSNNTTTSAPTPASATMPPSSGGGAP